MGNRPGFMDGLTSGALGVMLFAGCGLSTTLQPAPASLSRLHSPVLEHPRAANNVVQNADVGQYGNSARTLETTAFEPRFPGDDDRAFRRVVLAALALAVK